MTFHTYPESPFSTYWFTFISGWMNCFNKICESTYVYAVERVIFYFRGGFLMMPTTLTITIPIVNASYTPQDRETPHSSYKTFHQHTCHPYVVVWHLDRHESKGQNSRKESWLGLSRESQIHKTQSWGLKYWKILISSKERGYLNLYIFIEIYVFRNCYPIWFKSNNFETGQLNVIWKKTPYSNFNITVHWILILLFSRNLL